jgi:Tfp pilus assembly protein FimT
MRASRNTEGFSLIEVLVVISVMIIIMTIGSTYITGNFAKRRSVDEVTNNISSMLQLAKLKSVRDGVEYRVVLAKCDDIDDSNPDCPKCNSAASYDEYAAGDKEISLILERGDSNLNSTVWCMQSAHTKRFQSDLDLVASANLADPDNPLNFTFVPNGLRRDFATDVTNETLTIKPAAGSKIENCGQIQVSPMGGISVIEGKWDGSSQCNPILDTSVSPTPGP